jgi:N-acetylglucosamine-6-phosphate deacetylase
VLNAGKIRCGTNAKRLRNMIFINGRCLIGADIQGSAVRIDEGRICEIGRDLQPAAGEEVIDLAGNYLVPGFVDIHVHGARGRDTMDTAAEAFAAICDYHASGGTTSLLLTTATAPIEQITWVIEAVAAARHDSIAGVHVEGPFISKEKAGAQRQEFICDPDMMAVDWLAKHSNVVRRVTLAPELPGAFAATSVFAAAGISVSGGHSNAWDEEARGAFECGMRSVTHTFNCMSSARRRGVERVAGLLEFALSEPEIVCELIADGHHVSATLMRMLYRAKGPDGICLVTDATAGAGLPEGTKFSLAGRECVVHGGVCLLADGSALAGSAARMIDLVQVMVRRIGLPLAEAVKMASANPAGVIGLNDRGVIEVGKRADLVVLSEDLDVMRTFVAGREASRNS